MNALTVLIPLMLNAAAPDDAKAGKFGAILSEKAIVRVSSTCGYDTPETHLNLVRGPAVPCAFHTAQEKEPWVTLKLPAVSEVRALEILNRQDGSGFRAATLTAWLSEDGATWTEVWSAGGKAENKWIVPLTDAAGHGRKARWIKLSLRPQKPEFLHLSRVTVYGQ